VKPGSQRQSADLYGVGAESFEEVQAASCCRLQGNDSTFAVTAPLPSSGRDGGSSLGAKQLGIPLAGPRRHSKFRQVLFRFATCKERMTIAREARHYWVAVEQRNTIIVPGRRAQSRPS